MVEAIDYRFGTAHGWDHNKPVPKVNDLVVVITDRGGQKGQVMRLFEDDRDRQTIEVNDDLTSQYGTHTRYKRRGDIRPLHSLDKVVIENEKAVVEPLRSPLYYTGEEAIKQLQKHWSHAFDDDAVGRSHGMKREGVTLTLTLHTFNDPNDIDYILYNIALPEKGGKSAYEMIVIDSGNKYGYEWKYIFHMQTKIGVFIEEASQRN